MRFERALVIGGSMAGMLAARSLAEHVPVTLLERDPLPAGPDPRRGLPQAAHLHGILARGMLLLDRAFPGLGREMTAKGASLVDSGTELGWLGPSGWTAPFAPGEVESVWATRDFLDATVRARLRSDPRVEWVEGVRVDSLLFDARRRRVRGVRMADGAAHEADLVVDATGRGSRLPYWLREAGWQAPKKSEVDACVVYTSALARLKHPVPNGWKVLFVLGLPPGILRGGALGPVEGGRTIVSFATVGGEPAPTDTADFAAFGRSLRAPLFGELLGGAEWLTPARTTRSTANRRRHYERTRLPAGLAVIGDALCAFNPTFGQGVSVAAMQATELGRLLRSGARASPALGALATRHFARVADFPWAMATEADRAVPGTPGRASIARPLVKAYLDRLFHRATRDGQTNLRIARVFNLLDSPFRLYAPEIVMQVVREPAPTFLAGPVAPPERLVLPRPQGSPFASLAAESRRASS
jgi:2-polyprenyl-6-methoxyphenol hydroxylase-like FAD-dependent oxidoreductase